MRSIGWGYGLAVAAASLVVGGWLLARPQRAAIEPRTSEVEVVQPAVHQPRLATPSSLPSARPLAAPLAAAPSVPPIVSSAREILPVALPSPVSAPTEAAAVAALPAAAVPAPVASIAPPKPPESTRRRVELTRLSSWSKPGLCSSSEDAEAAREKLTAQFTRVDSDAQGQLYLDPRLPTEAGPAVVSLLARAQEEVATAVGARPPPPVSFVYFDVQLLKAAACINEDVVAFYDGALHLVAGRPDLQQSVTHELTHHSLFSSGLVGPAWAQEGIAMLVARESWWQTPARVQALLSAPFSAEQMDELIPYKLPSDQAVAFYVQSALTVQCLLARRTWSLPQLIAALRAGNTADVASYDLPELEQPSFLRDCANALSRNGR